MSIGNVILDIRKKHNLSQDQLADKLFVTRQAVSRWENGQTSPSIDILKQIAELFNLSSNVLLELEETQICQSCAMPLNNISDFGFNDDMSVNTTYCTHCYRNGQYTHNRTIEEMVESNLRFLGDFNKVNGTNYSPEEARTILKLHLETLKRWKK